jgi:hypothetical protein
MLCLGSGLQVFRSLQARVVAFCLGSSWVRPWVCLWSVSSLGSRRPTSSFYRPRWGSAVDGSFENEPLYRGKTECLTVARSFVRMCLIV